MIERKEIANEKTILIGTVKPGETDELIEEHLSELELLAETAGAEVIGKITQRISKINSATFIGKGKANQIINQATELNVKLAGIVDAQAAIDNTRYMNLPVVKTLSELGTVNALIITDMEKPQNTFDEIVQFFPCDQVLTLSLLGIKQQNENTPNFIKTVAEKIG